MLCFVFFNTPCLSVVHFLGLVLRFSRISTINSLGQLFNRCQVQTADMPSIFGIKLAPEFQFPCLYQTKSLLAKVTEASENLIKGYKLGKKKTIFSDLQEVE